MSRNIELYGYVDEHGGLFLPHREDQVRRMKEDLRKAKNTDVVITIKKKGKRSNRLNSYYFAAIVKSVQWQFREFGNDVDADTVHEFLKLNFNPVKITTLEGKEITVGGSTTDMNNQEFIDYCERIRRWAAEDLGIEIKDPGEQSKIFEDNE